MNFNAILQGLAENKEIYIQFPIKEIALFMNCWRLMLYSTPLGCNGTGQISFRIKTQALIRHALKHRRVKRQKYNIITKIMLGNG